MITPKNIQDRLMYIDLILDMYGKEKASLKELMQIYGNPQYKEIMELVELEAHRKVLTPQPEVLQPPATASPMVVKIDPPMYAFEMPDTPSYDRFHSFVYHNNSRGEIVYTKSATDAKRIGISNGTLTAISNFMADHDYLYKTSKVGVYKISDKYRRFLENWYEEAQI